jgi:threonine ammonia-lyase medium form
MGDDSGNVRLIGLDDLNAARAAIAGRLHRTPTCTCATLGERTDTDLYLKAELFQRTGSFKPRGALNKMLSLSDQEKSRGVITISAGNHAQGVAFAARAFGIRATVVMPEAAVRSKVEATRSYGAEVILHGSGKDLLPRALELQAERDLTFVPPFDDPYVIAGQGTVGLELLEDVPDAEVVVVPIGGGGLISGVATAVKLLRPGTRVVGVEPEGAPGMTLSLRDNAPAHLDSTNTIADGLAAPFVGALNLAHVQAYVDDVVLLSDEEIVAGLRLLMERAKLQAEPSGAAAFAALLAGKVNAPPGARVVCVVSGGNLDHAHLKEIL